MYNLFYENWIQIICVGIQLVLLIKQIRFAKKHKPYIQRLIAKELEIIMQLQNSSGFVNYEISCKELGRTVEGKGIKNGAILK